MTIHWNEIEKESGIKLEDKYNETLSIYKTGEFYGPYHGVYAISSHAVSKELNRRRVTVGQHEAMKNQFPWSRIIKKLCFSSEQEMYNILYWEEELTGKQIKNMIFEFTGYKMTENTPMLRMKKLGIKTRYYNAKRKTR